MKTDAQKIADLKYSLKVERGHVRNACQTIARLTMALRKIVEGGYAEGADRAHPAIAVARDAIDPKWRERAVSHYPKP